MRSKETNDCLLWSQFKKGDKNAFASLYRAYTHDLILYGSKICGDQDVLKDCIQDLFVELWNTRDNLAQVDSVRFYLLRALRYKIVRSEKKRQQQTPLLSVFSGRSFSRFEVSVESIIIEKEMQDSRIQGLYRAVGGLSKRQQEIIQLRFYQGLSKDQIARLMHLNPQSVSNLLYNALHRIKNNLKTAAFASALTSLFVFIFQSF